MAEKIEWSNDDRKIIRGVVFVLGLVFMVILLGVYGCPKYNIWSETQKGKAEVAYKTLQGEAELAQANSNRQIAVNEAHAKMESAKLLAEAEVERARGVAQANQIIGDSLK